jgi:hypothetical protein
MQLQEFVSGALIQIVDGIRDAQGIGAKSGAIVAPHEVFGDTKDLIHTEHGRPIHKVTFDVAVTSEEGKSSKGGIGVVVATIGFGTQGQADSRNTSVSRLNFSVPIVYPVQGDSEEG